MAEERKPRVCAYCRVSTGMDDQLDSYENQVEIYTNKILSNPDWQYAGIFADPAISGTTDNRPEFQKMLREAARHRIDIILVKSISRFARNTLLAIQTLKKLKDWGTTVQFEKENINTGVPYSDMMFTILAAFAQEESRNTSERIKKGNLMRYARGEARFIRTYGYESNDEGSYIINEEEAKIVKRIFTEYEHGKTTGEIARGLNYDGIRGPVGESWREQTIGNYLRNERYVGDILTGKTMTVDFLTHQRKKNDGSVQQYLIRDHHKGIIPREQYDRVQTIIKMKSDCIYPFEGFLVCPHCGEKLKKDRATSFPYWFCEADKFYIPENKLKMAMVRAYDQWKPAQENPIKKECPTMEKPEYWWMEALVDEVHFGEHENPDDQTITVKWFSDEETTVPSCVGPMWKKRVVYKNRERKKSKGGRPKKPPMVITKTAKPVTVTKPQTQSDEGKKLEPKVVESKPFTLADLPDAPSLSEASAM